MNESNRSWNTYLYYHPNCWVKQGLDYLDRNPYVEQSRRGRTLLLSKEDRTRRLKLITNYHSLEQRYSNLKTGYPERLLIEDRLSRQMTDIMMEVAIVGGIPKKWLEKLA